MLFNTYAVSSTPELLLKTQVLCIDLRLETRTFKNFDFDNYDNYDKKVIVIKSLKLYLTY